MITGPFSTGTGFGVPYSAALVGGVEEFLTAGDLKIMSGDVVNGIGSHPADLFVVNSATIDVGRRSSSRPSPSYLAPAAPVEPGATPVAAEMQPSVRWAGRAGGIIELYRLRIQLYNII